MPDESPAGAVLAMVARVHAPLLMRIAQGVLRDREAAKDACQDALLAALSHAAPTEEPQLRAWLAQVVLNRSLMMMRRRRLERRALLRAPRPSAEQATQLPSDRAADVRGLLEGLPENVRLVVTLRIVCGMSGNEVQGMLGLSGATISRRLYEGLDRLRQLVQARETAAAPTVT